MGKLPETLALFALVLVAMIVAADLASTAQAYGWPGRRNPFQEHWSLEFRRELAANPPGLLRDLRTAGGGPARIGFLGLAVALAAVPVLRLLLSRRRPGADAARGVGLLALLLAVAAAMGAWVMRPSMDLIGEFFAVDQRYRDMAPGLAVLRLGLAFAVAGHLLALLLEFLAARRAAR